MNNDEETYFESWSAFQNTLSSMMDVLDDVIDFDPEVLAEMFGWNKDDDGDDDTTGTVGH